MAVVGLLRRRAQIALAVVVLIALVAGGLTWAVAGAHRRSLAAVVLVPPALGSGVAQQNPLLHLDDVVQLAGALRIVLDSQGVRDHMVDRGLTASYRVGGGPGGDASPLLMLTTTGGTAAGAERTASALADEARSELAALQRRTQVPAAARVTLLEVAAPRPGRRVGTRPWVLAAVTALIVLVAGLLVEAAADLAVRRRSTVSQRDRFDPRPPTAAGLRHRSGGSSSLRSR